jgi:uncharacterized protein YecT (DUF1311 family)
MFTFAKVLSLGLLVSGLSSMASAQTFTPCADLGTTHEIYQCLVKEYARVDARLNKVWKLTLERSPSETARKALLSAQKAWITVRDLDCIVVGKEMEGGTFEKVLVQSCLNERTNERTHFLGKIFPDRN